MFLCDVAHLIKKTTVMILHKGFHNDPKFSDRLQDWANNVDPDQTAGLGKQCRPRSDCRTEKTV